MPKESGPQGKEMNRRDFLKAAAGIGVAGAVSSREEAQAQEYKTVDNHPTLFFFESEATKINYPDKPLELTPEMIEVMSTIIDYQKDYFRDGSTQQGVYRPEADLLRVREDLWRALKKFDPTLPEFSYDNFYQTLALKVPLYLSRYGIYTRPGVTYNAYNENGKPTSFYRVEFSFTFLEVEKVEHEEVEEWGVKMPIDILYVRNPVPLPGNDMGPDFPAAENGYRNIVFFEGRLNKAHENVISNIKQDQPSVAPNVRQEIIENKQSILESSNKWNDAANVAILKLVARINNLPTYAELKKQKLSHETRHLIDRMEGDQQRVLAPQITTDVNSFDLYRQNYKIHDEINPFISEMRYSPRRDAALLYYVAISRDFPGNIEENKIAEWVIRNMIEIIDEEGPEKYGIKISQIKVNRPHQILSQIDVLIDRPELFTELCEKLIKLHRLHLTDNLIGKISLRDEQDSAPIPTESLLSKLKPVAVGVGGATLAGLGFEALRRRKKKVGEESAKLAGMSRTERREYERKKKKEGR